MDPQKDYSGTNTYDKTKSRKTQNYDKNDSNNTNSIEDGFGFEFNEFEIEYHRQRDLKKQDKQ